MTSARRTDEPRRIVLVADELRGYTRHGGIGTATSVLAVALARMGHDVEVLFFGEGSPSPALDRDWADLQQRAGVRVRVAPRATESVEPPYFGRMRDVELALRDHEPDVVIAQDLAAPAYTALRMRSMGLSFDKTLFIVYCHGTRRWITDTSRKVRVLPGANAVTRLEQASLELADVVVSPSAYMVEWMREQRWQLPASTRVIPYPNRSPATGDSTRQAEAHSGRVARLMFFGTLSERKGLRPFLAGLNAMDPTTLHDIELGFLGAPTPAWDPGRITAALSESVKQAVSTISFETDLDQSEGLDRLARPGTLAVMPGLEDNSPNTVYECLARGIPFVASSTGGTAELVADDDHARVLFEPTPEGIADALRRTLTSDEALRPAQAAFDEQASLAAWADVVAMRVRESRHTLEEEPAIDVVVVDNGSRDDLSRCLAALDRQSYRNFRATAIPLESTIEAARRAGITAITAAWVLLLEAKDMPEPQLLEALVTAQQASQADVVSCGFYAEESGPSRTLWLFLGEPGGLGLLANGYGQVALLRRSVLRDLRFSYPIEDDPDWPLLARLSASGAKIVSVPAPLLTRRRRPGTIERNQADALLVAQEVERALPEQSHSLARLAAGLAANAVPPPPTADGGLGDRVARVLRQEGISGVARRATSRLQRLGRGTT